MTGTGPSPEVRALILDRDDHRCRRCGTYVWQDAEIHHRRPRKRGGTSRPEINSPENLVTLCKPCHRTVESHRTEAYDHGWLVREGIDGPLEIPLVNIHGARFWLTEEGEVTFAETSFLPADLDPPF
jgi:hypothetical protein